MIFDGQDRAFAMFGVALIITVGEPCLDFSQIACPDRPPAQRTERLSERRPAIHKDEPHAASPDAKQMMMCNGSDHLHRTFMAQRFAALR
jgi:hypothetical protein